MKSFLFVSFIVLSLISLSIVLVKTTTHFIKSTDPLAQQICVLDNAKSPEIVKIKGELMRDLVKYYYQRSDTVKSKK